MSELQTRLGYGRSGIVELDTFTRILKEQFYDTEEVRFDNPPVWDNSFEYIGVADSGSLTNSPVWFIIRRSWMANRVTRMQFQDNMAWDNRAQGWPQ